MVFYRFLGTDRTARQTLRHGICGNLNLTSGYSCAYCAMIFEKIFLQQNSRPELRALHCQCASTRYWQRDATDVAF
jgi:hypothetical protein